VTQLIGEVCVDRSKVPRDILFKVIKLITKLAMQKSEPLGEGKEDITKNKTLVTAVVTLAQDETDEELQESELELIGFLLKQNFDGIKIDPDYEEMIPSLVAKKLAQKQKGPAAILCMKVLGILTSQAVYTLAQS
jgi:hypothetical protein